jgi:hypothetical protein
MISSGLCQCLAIKPKTNPDNFEFLIFNFELFEVILHAEILNFLVKRLLIQLLTYKLKKMKRVFLFLGAIMISLVTLLTSCTEDNPVDTPPTINFVSGAGFISGDATLTVSTPFIIKILAEENATSGSNLKSLKITRVFNLQSWDTTLTFNESTYTLEASFTAQSVAGVERIEFIVTDNDGQTDMADLQITTEPVSGGAIDSWTERIMGSWANPTGSSFASINGNVYTIDIAFANQSLIDYMYWWAQSTNSATIGAPDDENAQLVFNEGDYRLELWTTKNPTRFKTTTVTSSAFDAITDATDIIDIATGADQTRLANLAVDQVIAFVTVTNKRGLIRVKSITQGSNGTITIDVKVEK